MTTARTTQAGAVAVGDAVPEAITSQAGAAVVAEVIPVAATTQAGNVVVGKVIPINAITQAGVIVLGVNGPCSTRRCQLWIITRADGVVFRFTSHDLDVTWGHDVYTACGSLSETASEQSSDQGSVGSIDLMGIIDSDHISDEDLYAGRFDDAFVEVWRKSWDDPTDTIVRIAAGNLGNVSQGEEGFKGEVVGPGGRLLQKPLLNTVTPTCRFTFGDIPTCGVDAEALAIVGMVIAASSRAFMRTDVTDPMISAQWDRGKLRFTYGRNAGQVCEVRSVDFASGLIILWATSGFTPEFGDTFELLPGCDLGFDGGCTVYDNRDRFGGYPDVPGQDAVSQVPLAKA